MITCQPASSRHRFIRQQQFAPSRHYATRRRSPPRCSREPRPRPKLDHVKLSFLFRQIKVAMNKVVRAIKAVGGRHKPYNEYSVKHIASDFVARSGGAVKSRKRILRSRTMSYAVQGVISSDAETECLSCSSVAPVKVLPATKRQEYCVNIVISKHVTWCYWPPFTFSQYYGHRRFKAPKQDNVTSSKATSLTPSARPHQRAVITPRNRSNGR